MSLIKDARLEIARIEKSAKAVKKFSLSLLVVVVFLAAAGYIYHWEFSGLWLWGSSILVFLSLLGFAASRLIMPIYVFWMTFAFILGWFVSKTLAILVFYFMITPVAFILRIMNKKVIDLDFADKQATYWVVKPGYNKTDYEKLF